LIGHNAAMTRAAALALTQEILLGRALKQARVRGVDAMPPRAAIVSAGVAP
jgi:hypothetical protein